MKIKEGGGMDINKEIDRLDVEITDLISDFSIEHFLPNVGDDELEIIVAKAIKFGMLVAERDSAKAQAVPEWKDYTVESPRIDGPYQIFIMNQQLVAKWESPWGFSSIEDGDALNQELITHWSVLGNDPAIEAQEPAND